jgi:hypothetical protein
LEIENQCSCVLPLLKLGKPNAEHKPFDSVLNIHPSLGNADRLSYYRQLMLDNLGLSHNKPGSGGGDKFLTDMFKWSKSVTFFLK